MTPELKIIFQDQHYVAVDKPENLLVHRTAISSDRRFLLQELRNQIGQRLYPVHRLDRPTSGVIVLALHSEAAQKLQTLFLEKQIQKTYWAVVRGYTKTEGKIEATVQEDKNSPALDALTRYKRLATVELPIAVDIYPTSRYSLVQAQPVTGRYHQIRKHFARVSHPVMGDVKHGTSVHNRFFREHYHWHRLMLRAKTLELTHPYSQEKLKLDAGIDPEFTALLESLFGVQISDL